MKIHNEGIMNGIWMDERRRHKKFYLYWLISAKLCETINCEANYRDGLTSISATV